VSPKENLSCTVSLYSLMQKKFFQKQKEGFPEEEGFPRICISRRRFSRRRRFSKNLHEQKKVFDSQKMNLQEASLQETFDLNGRV
jgi:hypothetical protein